VPYHGRPYALMLMVPPLAVVCFTVLQARTHTADAVRVVA